MVLPIQQLPGGSKHKGAKGKKKPKTTVLTAGVIQMRIDCRSICASTPGSRITRCAHPHPPGFVHRLYIPGFGWGLWEPGSDMPWGGDRVRPTGPPPSDDTIVGISRHHSPPLAFRWVRRAPSSHQYLLGGCPLVGNPLPRLSPLSDDRPGVPPLIFNPYVLFILYNHDFIDSVEKRENKYSRKKYLKNTRP
jgi:hypothetical protein